MEVTIVTDSSCDLSPADRAELGVVSIPLGLMLGETCILDDDTLDVDAYVTKMNAYPGKVGSHCPSPALYADAFLAAGRAFGVTLSSQLSGSYDSAVMGAQIAAESGADAHVFDSKSASAGQILVVRKLRELLDLGKKKDEIIEATTRFIDQMRTYFVLENLDNLVKNGRVGRVKGRIISVLGIHPIMGADKDGHIALFSKARGAAQIIEQMSGFAKNAGRDTSGDTAVITHCDNNALAERLRDAISGCFRDVFIYSTRGLSSTYANRRGIILAF